MSERGTPTPSSPDALRRMRSVRQRDTKAELALRRELHCLGLRYRVDASPVEGIRRRADLVFSRAKVAVYVDGCFWHVCPEHATWPRANAVWWRDKLHRNVERDRSTDRALAEVGWFVVRVWEHEAAAATAARVAAAVHARLRQVDPP
jgi:DNA mismatch endonuclease, patch repair protein